MEKMRIVLKRDWDIPLQLHTEDNQSKTGHFAGRETEVNMLSNEILRKSTGSILVSGYRGVGKTSLVYKALHIAQKKDKGLIVVLLNAAQLDADPVTELKPNEQGQEKITIAPQKIIENLIRRLYSKTKSDGGMDEQIRNRINTLYRKAISREFRSSQASRMSQEGVSEKVSEKKIFAQISSESLRKAISTVWIIIVATLQFVPEVPQWIKIVSLLMLIPYPFFVSFVTNKLFSQRQTDCKKIEAEELYEFDNSIGNLEFDLEEIHKELKAKNKKLVYVIDELDKLDSGQVKNVCKRSLKKPYFM